MVAQNMIVLIEQRVFDEFNKIFFIGEKIGAEKIIDFIQTGDVFQRPHIDFLDHFFIIVIIHFLLQIVVE